MAINNGIEQMLLTHRPLIIHTSLGGSDNNKKCCY